MNVKKSGYLLKGLINVTIFCKNSRKLQETPDKLPITSLRFELGTFRLHFWVQDYIQRFGASCSPNLTVLSSSSLELRHCMRAGICHTVRSARSISG